MTDKNIKTLNNGFTARLVNSYDNMFDHQFRYDIYTPKGRFYKTVRTYKEAMDLTKRLRVKSK